LHVKHLPATDTEEQERKGTKHGIDAKIQPKTLIGMFFIVLRPKFDPDGYWW
jgi:hypothetical protein